MSNQQWPNDTNDIYSVNQNDVLDESGSTYRDLSNLPIDEVQQPVVFENAVYRSVGAVMPQSSLLEPGMRTMHTLERPALTKNYSDSKNISIQLEKRSNDFIPALASSVHSGEIKSHATLAEKPLYVLPTNIVCDMRLDLIRSSVSHVLEQYGEISYQYDATKCQWKGAYVRGTSFCKFQIFVYVNSPRGYIVEIQREKGDCAAFHIVFRALKSALTTNSEISRFDSFQTASPLNGCYETPAVIGDDDSQAALQTVVDMCKLNSIEARLEACKMICDFSYHNESLELLKDSGCINVLVELLAIGCPCTQRNAILALTNLSESHSCQEAIVESGILPTLFGFCVDNTYETSETRRACARVLANVSTRLASRIVNKMKSEVLEQWMQRIDTIEDSKIRLHANRAKTAIQRAVVA